METLFESICKITQPLLCEIVTATVHKRNKTILLVGSFLFAVLAALCFIVKDYLLGGIVTAFIAFYIWRVLSMPARTSKKVFAQYVGNSKKDHVKISVSFAELDITVKTAGGGQASHYEYADLCSITETENLYLLDMGNKTMIYVAKDGFTKGTCDEFIKFITERAELCSQGE